MYFYYTNNPKNMAGIVRDHLCNHQTLIKLSNKIKTIYLYSKMKEDSEEHCVVCYITLVTTEKAVDELHEDILLLNCVEGIGKVEFSVDQISSDHHCSICLSILSDTIDAINGILEGIMKNYQPYIDRIDFKVKKEFTTNQIEEYYTQDFADIFKSTDAATASTIYLSKVHSTPTEGFIIQLISILVKYLNISVPKQIHLDFSPDFQQILDLLQQVTGKQYTEEYLHQFLVID